MAARWHSARPPFLVGLAGAAFALWLSGDPAPPAPQPVVAASPQPRSIVDTLAPGQTLSDLWQEHEFDAGELPAVVDAGRSVVSWRQLRAGAVARFRLTRSGDLGGIDLQIDRDRRVILRRDGPSYVAGVVETRFDRETRLISECIESSLWEALQRGGEEPTLTVAMAEILAAQVDFYTDIHPGDCIETVITVDARPDGSYRLASVDAIRLDLSSKTHEAYRFGTGEGRAEYYDSEGQSLKRRFLRSPLKFARISSGFGVRVHPITRRRRPHNGVDYVAPIGTPVQASGDGEVVQAGRHGGHGLYVKLRHGEKYSTSYSHLSRIASGIRRGASVEQGQVIGYVGSTGMSTGAHLDYRFMKDGRYVDPLSTDLPTAEPLAGIALEEFRAQRDDLRSRLDIADGSFAADMGTVPAAR